MLRVVTGKGVEAVTAMAAVGAVGGKGNVLEAWVVLVVVEAMLAVAVVVVVVVVMMGVLVVEVAVVVRIAWEAWQKAAVSVAVPPPMPRQLSDWLQVTCQLPASCLDRAARFPGASARGRGPWMWTVEKREQGWRGGGGSFCWTR